MRENETEAGKVRWVQWVRPDGPDDVGGPVRRRWGRTLTRAPQLHFAEGFCTGHTSQRSGCMEGGHPEPRLSPPRSSGVETFHQPDEPGDWTHESSDRPAATGHRCCQAVYTHHGQPTDVGFHHSHGCRLAEVMNGDSQILQLPEDWTPHTQLP